jgi:hypothetical protein
MFNTAPANMWIPYVIPPCPTVSAGDKYALSAKLGAVPSQNPSKFLEWKELLPKGSTKGDILYWDPSAGDGGDWVVLAAPSAKGSILYWDDNDWNFLAPPSGSGLKVLTATGGELAWIDTEDC